MRRAVIKSKTLETKRRTEKEEPLKEKEGDGQRWMKRSRESGYHVSQNSVEGLFIIKCNREKYHKLRTELKNIHWDRQ